MSAYTLTLTENDIVTIAFVGDRYSWSRSLRCLEEGANSLEEWEAWVICEAFESDTAGNHSPFPMLAEGDLMARLYEFWESIV